MKQLFLAFLAALALSLPASAWAHEGHVHKILGTVTKIDGQHITLKTTAGKTQVVMLGAKTTITRGTEKVEASAIAVGQRISVDAMQEKDMMMAQAVKLAAKK